MADWVQIAAAVTLGVLSFVLGYYCKNGKGKS